MAIPLVDLKKQYQSIKTEMDAAIMNTVESTQFILGPSVKELEDKIAALCRMPYAIGVASGTDALLLSLKALGIGPGDEVILPPFTFFATAGAVHNAGATPVFVDIDPMTYNLDPEKIEAAITPKTKAIIPVHLYGQCADMEAITAIACQHSLYVIEDSAQSLGAAHHGKPACSMGITGCISFFPTKNLGGYGDGGMVVTPDENIAKRLRMLRVHGEVSRYIHKEVGLNSRLDGLQAAILLAKFPRLHQWNTSRRENAMYYNQLFAGSRVSIPFEKSGNECIYNQYTIKVHDRDKVMAHLSSKGIACAIYYPVPLHLQECFSYLDYREGDFPMAEKAAKEVLSLPIFAELTRSQLEEIATTVLEVV